MKSLIRGLAAISFISSFLLFFLASFLGSITIRTAQPNGLAEIVQPYSAFGFFGQVASAGLFLFGLTLLFASHKGSTLEKKQLQGSALLSGGVLTILVVGFLILVNWQDEGPRCLGGCPVPTLNYYNELYIIVSIISVLGFVMAALGMNIVTRKENGTRRSNKVPDIVRQVAIYTGIGAKAESLTTISFG